MWQALAKAQLFLTFCINHQPRSSATKKIKVHVCSATNPTVFPRKLKIALKILPTIAGNASIAFSAILLSASASLSSHFFKAPLSFGGETPVPLPPANACNSKYNCWIVIVMTVNIENMVIPCSRNRVRILSANNEFSWRNFSRLCLILAICVWRPFRFCASISSLALFSVFKSSNLSLYNYFCSSV